MARPAALLKDPSPAQVFVVWPFSRGRDWLKDRGGCYVLRIGVPHELTLSFGGFRHGEPLNVLPGNWIYVGSAAAPHGALSLANRLMRNALRCGLISAPHPIRRLMHTKFCEAGLCDTDAEFSSEKKLKWNVDHLLEQQCVELVAAYAMPGVKLEELLGLWIQKLPAARIDHRRLGAADYKNNTHLLRIAAGDEWWEQFSTDLPMVVRAMTKLEAAGAGKLVRAALKQRHITTRQLRSLSNMHADRRNFILRRVCGDHLYAKADRESQERGIYDTLGWGEVISRLGRGRGGVRKAIASLLGPGADLLRKSKQASEITDDSKQLVALSQRLWHQVSGRWEAAVGDPSALTRHRSDISERKVKRVSSRQLRGYLKACIAFLQKNVRDAPQIYHKTGFEVTVEQQTKIESQLVDILRSCAVLDEAITRTR
jgi:Uri superfamily endonuclease